MQANVVNSSAEAGTSEKEKTPKIFWVTRTPLWYGYGMVWYGMVPYFMSARNICPQQSYRYNSHLFAHPEKKEKCIIAWRIIALRKLDAPPFVVAAARPCAPCEAGGSNTFAPRAMGYRLEQPYHPVHNQYLSPKGGVDGLAEDARTKKKSSHEVFV